MTHQQVLNCLGDFGLPTDGTQYETRVRLTEHLNVVYGKNLGTTTPEEVCNLAKAAQTKRVNDAATKGFHGK